MFFKEQSRFVQEPEPAWLRHRMTHRACRKQSDDVAVSYENSLFLLTAGHELIRMRSRTP